LGKPNVDHGCVLNWFFFHSFFTDSHCIGYALSMWLLIFFTASFSITYALPILLLISSFN